MKYSDINFEQKTMMVRKNITTAKKRNAEGIAVGGVQSISYLRRSTLIWVLLRTLGAKV